jgi:hypothetical protein
VLALVLSFLLGVAVARTGIVTDDDLTPGLVTECRDSVIDRITLMNLIAANSFTPEQQQAVRTLPAPCQEDEVISELNPVTLDLLEDSPIEVEEDDG